MEACRADQNAGFVSNCPAKVHQARPVVWLQARHKKSSEIITGRGEAWHRAHQQVIVQSALTYFQSLCPARRHLSPLVIIPRDRLEAPLVAAMEISPQRTRAQVMGTSLHVQPQFDRHVEATIEVTRCAQVAGTNLPDMDRCGTSLVEPARKIETSALSLFPPTFDLPLFL
jgi:hypothetical protein